MEFTVTLTRKASRELHKVADWYDNERAGLGERWLRGMRRAISSLSKNPDRFGLAHESDLFEYDLRELYYGVARRKTHRALFRISKSEVIVLGIRHFSQRDVSPDDFC